MVLSKEWDWSEADKTFWTNPCEESYYYAYKWKSEGRKTVLDLGCGLGRHAILMEASISLCVQRKHGLIRRLVFLVLMKIQ